MTPTETERIAAILLDFATKFAEQDEGEWWGYDSDLGDMQTEFKEAAAAIAEVVRVAREHEIHLLEVNTIGETSAQKIRDRITHRLAALRKPDGGEGQ
jgi:predicted small metal-binding protein